MKLSELARLVNGEVIGEGDTEISGVAALEEALPGEISYLAMHAYREQVLTTQASAVIVSSPIEGCEALQVICSDPYLAFARCMRLIYPNEKPSGEVSELAVINDARLGEGATIHPFVYLGHGVTIGRRTVIYPHVHIGDGVSIGDDVIVHSHVSIRERSQIGNRVILQDGCRIGSDGYGFAQDERGEHLKIPQMGRVIIGDDVEIGANCCIDRATLSATVVGRGSKFDNLVQVGHNVTIGQGCLLVAQVGIAGSSKIGNRVTLAGQVGVSGHLTIGDGATVGGKSAVTRDVPADEVYTGYPAMPHRLWAKMVRSIRRMIESEGKEEE